VARHQVRLVAILEDLIAGKGGAEDRRLGPARAVSGALEQVVRDLRLRELEQVGPVALDLVAHVRGLAPLAGEQHG
jgi:hypothetical protein